MISPINAEQVLQFRVGSCPLVMPELRGLTGMATLSAFCGDWAGVKGPRLDELKVATKALRN